MRVVAYVPDLMFGSRVLTELQGAGHEPVLVGELSALDRELGGSQLLIVDLTVDAQQRIAGTIDAARRAGVPALAFYSHVDVEVRAQAQRAGFDLVVPRSRMAREGVALVERFSG